MRQRTKMSGWFVLLFGYLCSDPDLKSESAAFRWFHPTGIDLWHPAQSPCMPKQQNSRPQLALCLVLFTTPEAGIGGEKPPPSANRGLEPLTRWACMAHMQMKGH